MRREEEISPYLKRPLRSFEEVLRLRKVRRGADPQSSATGSDRPPPAKPA
ncbi:MAG: hypothetical protein RLN99_04005 [Kiloniellaceae bacterium]